MSADSPAENPPGSPAPKPASRETPSRAVLTLAPGVALPLFHVVLHEPEIPNNTGNIGRTCVATGCSLHLIRPLGFDTSAKACRRAGLDYWPRLNVQEHDSFDALEAALPRARTWFFTTKAARTLFDVRFELGDVLLFGKETAGLPPSILAQAGDRAVAFPMLEGERSLNLATAVCSAIYEGVRQLKERNTVYIRVDSAPVDRS